MGTNTYFVPTGSRSAPKTPFYSDASDIIPSSFLAILILYVIRVFINIIIVITIYI